MVKKIVIAIVALCLVGTAGFTAFGVYRSISERPSFYTGGYVLQGDAGEAKQLNFSSETAYTVTRAGYVTFEDAEGERASIRRESFVYLDDNSVMALSAGILLDFNDLSENFINNYYIPSGMVIASSGGNYTAQTTSGAMNFGEHLWKLSDNKYLIQSAQLKVHFSDADEREVENYVQVAVTADGIVQILTPENLWATISENCYIETAGGVRIYPVTQLVDNGSYRLSLPKLSVTTEDSIVLTEDETRRQIVPELNFEVEDGADGEDGTDGESGQNGENGVDGEVGQNGEVGRTGEDGVNGTTGRTGVDGTDGAAGAAGANGAAGRAGSSGSSGRSGSSGADGGTGPKGNDAQLQSSTNTALPTMTVTSWEVTATTLSGAITISDESELLANVVATDTRSYNATITIYNEETGESIRCYPLNASDPSDYGYRPGADLFDGATIEFTSMTAQNVGTYLQPDTAYRLSVVAYYAANDMVYSREFLSRAFYTDSTGAILTYDSATENSVTITSEVTESYADSVNQVQVFLLTPAQNSALNTGNMTNPNNYTGRYELTYQAGKITDVMYYDDAGTATKKTVGIGEPLADLEFPDLPANTKYIGRVYVQTMAGSNALSTLTKQELELSTLKTEPTWNSADGTTVLKPTAYYNRVTGAFEVYHPTVKDPDGGVQRYIYTAYNEKNEVVGTRTLPANETGKVDFFLPQGTYTFNVRIEFDDNEKIVSYDMRETDPVTSSGGTMPRLTLQKNSLEYNKMHGVLTLDLINAQTGLYVDATHPLTLHVYANQVYDRDIVIEGTGDTYTAEKTVGDKQSLYKAVLTHNSGSTNNASIALELDNLYQNTNYTVTVTGYVNFGEGGSVGSDLASGYTERAIGTVSFMTPAAPKTTTAWSASGTSTTAAISRTLKIEANVERGLNESDDQLKEREEYIVSQLLDGQVTLRLYSGTGAGRTLLSEVKLTNSTAEKYLDKIYTSTEGLEVTNTLFDIANLNTDSNYTIEVYQIADQTYGLTSELGYVNLFDASKGNPTIVTAQATPPALMTNPTGGVTAMPILNKNVTTYGGVYDNKLDDDAIVGYLLQSQYDNSQRLALSVTYYAFEYLSFYNSLVQGRQDPVEKAIQGTGSGAAAAGTLVDPKELTYTVVGSDRVPGVALLFGNEPTTDQPGPLPGTHAGYNVYYAGVDVLGSNLNSGMDRGYRYLFAYTVEYSQTSGDVTSSAVYPYETREYQDYMITYGAGSQYGKTLGAGVAYILNSGMQEAPKVEPEFYTYVYQTTNTVFASGSSSGNLEIHYAWRDTDGAIDQTASKKTMIWYEAPNGTLVSSAIDADPITGSVSPQWYKVTVSYSTVNSEGEETIVSPTVEITRYLIDYKDLMEGLTSGTEYADQDDSFYLCHIPVEDAWGARFNDPQNANQVQVRMDMSHQSENYIIFQLAENAVGANLSREMAQRAFAMRLHFTLKDNPDAERTLYLPMEYSAQYQNHVRLATGELGQDYLGKEFTVDATVLYDTGDQGWGLTEAEKSSENNRFALQYINSSNDPEEFGFQTYYMMGSGQGGALIRRDSPDTFSAEAIRKVLKGSVDTEEDRKTSITFVSAVTNAYRQNWLLYPTHWGVNMSGGQSLEGMNRYIVPKGVATYALLFENGTNSTTGTLTSITPTITRGELRPSSTAIDIGGFTISGKEQTNQVGGKYVVYAALYTSEAAAKNLGSDGLVSDQMRFTLTDAGEFVPAGGNNRMEIKDPGNPDHAAKDYYVTFYVNMGTPGRNVLLIDRNTANPAIYKVTSSEKVIFGSHLGVLYLNTSYLSKQLELSFTMSRSANVSVRYDIYSSATNFNAGTLVMSQEEMVEAGITNPPATFTTGGNTITIDMTPAAAREKLKPGSTYYLRLVANEPGMSEDAGSQVFKFDLNPVMNYDPLIYVRDANGSSISFQVTMHDVEYSFMSGGNDVANGAALYGVRFFQVDTVDGKEEETRLFTDYDNQLFSTLSAQSRFVLDMDHITQAGKDMGQKIAAERTYRMKVFAVVDLDHTGQSKPVDASGTTWNWKQFFDKVTEAADKLVQDMSEGFMKLLESFWDNNGKTVEAMKDIQDDFAIGVKTQATTNDSGILLNHDRAAIVRISTARLRMQLAESFGVVTAEPGNQWKQAFQKVSWSIVGQTSDGTPFNQTGDDTTQLFEKSTDAAGNDVYYYPIPCDVPTGAYYYITIQLYTTADGTTPYDTFSFYHVG